MRWCNKLPPLPGDWRTIRRFLFLPKTVGRETRFLEFASIKQKYQMVGNVIAWDYEWIDIKWVD